MLEQLTAIENQLHALRTKREASSVDKMEAFTGTLESIERALGDLVSAIEGKGEDTRAAKVIADAIKSIKFGAQQPVNVTSAAPTVRNEITVSPTPIENRVEVPPAQVVVQPAPGKPVTSAVVKFEYEYGRISGATITFKRG